jgi:hypothetical protein
MTLSCPRSFAVFTALFALVSGCGMTTPEAARPAPDSSTAGPVAADADVPTPPPTPAAELVMSQDLCQSDSDCVPAACCHATACMSREKAKPCNVMCTQVCEPGTLDCGGACLCQAGHCAARLGNGGK